MVTCSFQSHRPPADTSHGLRGSFQCLMEHLVSITATGALQAREVPLLLRGRGECPPGPHCPASGPAQHFVSTELGGKGGGRGDTALWPSASLPGNAASRVWP